ncbi:MAG: phosphatase PAP2 family protein [Chitinophagaceae bacterium]|nr:phosphatase PAP2 family protein [Chitinophagaceae bacterium]
MKNFLYVVFFSTNCFTLKAQVLNDSGATKKISFKRTIRSLIVPTALIAYGASIIHDNGIYSSYQIQRDVRKAFPDFRTKADSYLEGASYGAMVAMGLSKITPSRNWQNSAVRIAKSELLSLVLVRSLKKITHIQRPDSISYRSFPSGHTAQLFCTAAVFQKEVKNAKPWMVVSFYTVAGAVGVMRVLNNRHWASDVIAGAGIGILSVNIVQLTHKNKWGKKNLSEDLNVIPFFGTQNSGILLSYKL